KTDMLRPCWKTGRDSWACRLVGRSLPHGGGYCQRDLPCQSEWGFRKERMRERRAGPVAMTVTTRAVISDGNFIFAGISEIQKPQSRYCFSARRNREPTSTKSTSRH